MFAADSSSERATSILDYQNTCSNFIIDISKDYMDWVDRYNLDKSETHDRKSRIESIVNTTNEWIYKYADTIKKVDLVMNDGVNKMAESTAGYPFQFEVIVDNCKRYVIHDLSQKLLLRLITAPRPFRKARIGKYQKDQVLLVNSSSPVSYKLSEDSVSGGDLLDDYIVIDTENCLKNDLISVTAVVEEFNQEGDVTESRGLSTLILLI